MDPISAGVALAGTGAALNAFSSIRGGYNKQQQLQSEANAADINAQIATQQAQQASAVAVSNSNQQADKATSDIGRQIAQTAESGIGFTGTGGALIRQSQDNAELDRENILYQGLLQNQQYTYQSQLDTYQANVYRSGSNSAVAGGYLGAIGGVLNSAGSIAALSSYKMQPNNIAEQSSTLNSPGGYYNYDALNPNNKNTGGF